MKVKYTFFAILFFSAFFASAQTPSVSVQLNPSSVCPGQPLQISVVVSGIFPADTFVSDNVFTLLLSDSSGSFAAPDTIAVLQTPNDTTVTVTVPVLPGSNHYQIAVTGSDPLVDGVPASLKVRNLLAPPNVTFTYKTDNLCTGDSVKLSVDSVAHVAYTWYKNDTALANAHPFYLVAKKQAEYTVMFTDTSVAGCSSGSDSVFVSVFAYPPKPTVTETGPTNFCGTGSVTITAHDADTGTVTYQWIDHGDTLPGVTSSTYTVTVSGVYSVIANYHGCSTWPADSIGVNIASVPVVSLQLSPDSFCLYGPTVELSGGTPAGGYFTGNYVVGSNQFNQTLAGLGSFKVYYWFTDSIGCTTRDSGTINILDCTAAGITETNNAPAISLYPNPTSSTVAISIGQAGQVNLKVINLMGQTLSTQVFERELHYNLENLCAGTYMLQLTGPDNSWTTVKKLVVE